MCRAFDREGNILRIETESMRVFSSFHYTQQKMSPLSSRIIQASRVDQAICDEAEAGRIHGNGIIDAGVWIFNNGFDRIHLHQGYRGTWGRRCLALPLDHFAGGEPLIENHVLGTTHVVNGLNFWLTQFLYLRASILQQILGFSQDHLGMYDIEYGQAVALGGIWGLTGNWGDKNRLGYVGYWHDDDSLLTTDGDTYGDTYLVNDARGIPQYAVLSVATLDGTLLLPYRYLKRVGFWGPRRVFFPPEENIAIWFKQKIDANVKNIILTDNFSSNFSRNVIKGSTVIGCLPGSTASVNKTDISTLRGRECWIPIFGINDCHEVEFAVSLAARLRREYQNPHIVCSKGNLDFPRPVDIGLSELCQLAVKHKIFVPEELRGEYLGDLTDTIAKYVPSPIIDKVLNAGEIVRIAESDIPSLLLATHIAKQLKQGRNIFGKFWCVPGPQQSAFIIDRGSARIVAQYPPLDGVKVRDCSFIDFKSDERVKAFFALVGSARVVIITASELIAESSDFCLEILHQCINRNIAVIVFPDAELVPKLNRMVSRTFTASCIDGNKGRSIAVVDHLGDASVEITFDVGGVLRGSKKLSTRVRDMVSPVKAIPALPPDDRTNEALAQLPLEKRLPYLMDQNKK